MTEKKQEIGNPAPMSMTSLGGVRRRPTGLGRGLGALLDDAMPDRMESAGPDRRLAEPGSSGAAGRSPMPEALPIADIRPMPGQPRRTFDEAQLAELAESIAARGVLQPILVRPAPDGAGYQLVAGERRWRAAQRAGLHVIPALVRDIEDGIAFEIALIENIQRADLNAIEEARGYRRLIDEFGHSQDALSKLLGKSRSHVANMLRLLDLPAVVQGLVIDRQLSMGHARALIGSERAELLARQAVTGGWSVRKVEAMVRAGRADNAEGTGQAGGPADRTADPDIAAVESHLAERLGVSVAIDYRGKGAGVVQLRFANLEQLDLICQRLSGESF